MDVRSCPGGHDQVSDETDKLPAVLREAQRTARPIFVNGVPWLVYELPPPPFDRRREPSLIFECEDVVRRVRQYPANWRELTDEDLFALSWCS
jgi:hypothetical protein